MTRELQKIQKEKQLEEVRNKPHSAREYSDGSPSANVKENLENVDQYATENKYNFRDKVRSKAPQGSDLLNSLRGGFDKRYDNSDRIGIVSDKTNINSYSITSPVSTFMNINLMRYKYLLIIKNYNCSF